MIQSQTAIMDRFCFSPQAVKELNEICSGFLKKLGLTTFEFARVYDDQTALILYSDPFVGRYIVENKVHVTAHVPSDVLDKEFWYLPAADGEYRQLLKDIREIGRGGGFVDLVRRSLGYFDMFCFWSPEDQNDANTRFLNKKEKLETFCNEFVDRGQPLIHASEMDKFNLPPPMHPNFRGLVQDQQQIGADFMASVTRAFRRIAQFNPNCSPFTDRDLECIYYLMLGKTAQDIAERSKLSVRTIEQRIESIRHKLDCKKKSEIVEKFISIASPD